VIIFYCKDYNSQIETQLLSNIRYFAKIKKMHPIVPNKCCGTFLKASKVNAIMHFLMGCGKAY
jgi:hypothetical protein